MTEVIRLSDRLLERRFPRRLFMCEACECRTFKIFETDGEVMIECANCESQIDIDDILGEEHQ